jgi:hypothetical protein
MQPSISFSPPCMMAFSNNNYNRNQVIKDKDALSEGRASLLEEKFLRAKQHQDNTGYYHRSRTTKFRHSTMQHNAAQYDPNQHITTQHCTSKYISVQ